MPDYLVLPEGRVRRTLFCCGISCTWTSYELSLTVLWLAWRQGKMVFLPTCMPKCSLEHQMLGLQLSFSLARSNWRIATGTYLARETTPKWVEPRNIYGWTRVQPLYTHCCRLVSFDEQNSRMPHVCVAYMYALCSLYDGHDTIYVYRLASTSETSYSERINVHRFNWGIFVSPKHCMLHVLLCM